MIYGIGVDSVDIARFEAQLEKTPALLARLFTPDERDLASASLAARFAAKEALVKAFGDSSLVVQSEHPPEPGETVVLGWQDIEVLRVPKTRPEFTRTTGLDCMMHAAGVTRAHLSLTHDGGLATAFVVLEASVPTRDNTERE